MQQINSDVKPGISTTVYPYYAKVGAWAILTCTSRVVVVSAKENKSKNILNRLHKSNLLLKIIFEYLS